MTAPDIDTALQRAVHSGVLPAGATAPVMDSRPWPVVLLIALGAWLAALPLLAVVGLLLGDLLQRGVGPYFVGALMLAGATVVLRSCALPVFVEQLALPALLVGLLALGVGLFRDLDHAAAAALLSLLCLALALAVPRPWLRVLLGAAAALLCGVACAPRVWSTAGLGGHSRPWLALHAMMALWLLALAALDRLAPRHRAALDSVQAGWLLATLAGLAWWSGMTMLAGASLGGGIGGDIARMPWQLGRAETLPMQAVSLLLALAAAGWTARRWPPLRQPWCAAAAVAVAALALPMPALGAALLALALTATASRWRLAAAAALAAAWIVGAFYYALVWPLQLKAVMLLGAGAWLGAVAAWAWRAQRAPAAAAPAAATSPMGRARTGLALSTAAVLAVANGGIWQKEALIANGRPLFVELVPVDPRSLMQGDYMALRFALPAVTAPPPGLLRPTRPTVLARRDPRGVATLHPLAPGASPLPDEVLIELTPKNGDWVLVTDAWFFTEGEAARWAQARYGEFRVDGSGRALLVGLRGAQLQAL